MAISKARVCCLPSDLWICKFRHKERGCIKVGERRDSGGPWVLETVMTLNKP